MSTTPLRRISYRVQDDSYSLLDISVGEFTEKKHTLVPVDKGAGRKPIPRTAVNVPTSTDCFSENGAMYYTGELDMQEARRQLLERFREALESKHALVMKEARRIERISENVNEELEYV